MAVNSIPVLPSTHPTARPVAVDTVGLVDYQIIKTAVGGDGVAVWVEDVDGSRFPVGGAQIGATNEAAPGTDTAASGLNGRLQRIAQRLTSLIALLPASLGAKAEAASFAVTASTEDVARIGATNEAAPGTDTAVSGLNGRLQRIAQRLTSLIALLPASLGAKVSANSFSVVLATDQAAIETYAVAISLGATVVNGQTVQGTGSPILGYAVTGIIVPSTFDGSQITFQVSNDNNTYYTLYDVTNTQVAMTVSASRAYPLFGELSGWAYVKIVCGTAQSGSDTVFLLQLNSLR